MSSNNQPSPQVPGQQAQGQAQYQQNRPRAKSGFSFHSKKSSTSSNHNNQKIDLHETHNEKQSNRLTTKADPSMAITEAEPSAVAREQSSIAPIRALQHKDNQGNPIADPDRSNPTRSRWERPLDTIRAFEAAIDGNYSRKSYMRTESDGPSTSNRQSSYYGGTQVSTDDRHRDSRYQNGYGGRSQSYRPESFVDGRVNGMTRPDSYYSGADNAGHANGYHPNRARYPRTASEPHFNHGQVYPVPGNQQSYETVTTASGSGSMEPAGYTTDPSSENSSVDRIAPLPVKEPGEQYGFNGFGGNPQYSLPGSGLQQEQYVAGGGGGHQNQTPPVPQKAAPIKLGTADGNVASAPPPTTLTKQSSQKRKSWFGKRFSKA